MKHNRKKINNRKYKRLMAALAGAAVVTTTMLPGLPGASAQGMDAVITATPSDKQPNHDKRPGRPQQTVGSPVDAVKKSASKYGFNVNRDKFTLQSQTAREAVVRVVTSQGKTSNVYLSVRNGSWQITSVQPINHHQQGSAYQAGHPINVVKKHAATFGFDARRDHFSLLSMNNTKAVVQVKTSGQTFKVDLEKRSGNWIVTTIRGIGNSKYPATFRPASMYGYAPGSSGGIATSLDRTLYTTNQFADWNGQQSAYASDMKVGVLLSQAGADNVPASVAAKITPVDFDRQLVLYAYIGSVPDAGYGIGIEKVVQSGNNLKVTVKTKSPQASSRLSPTKINDVVPLSRASLNFNNPIQIQFVDQNGAVLVTHKLIN